MRRLPVALIFFLVVSAESEKAIAMVLCVVAVKEDHIAFFQIMLRVLSAKYMSLYIIFLFARAPYVKCNLTAIY
jgi:hypothetical protein